MHSTIKKYRMRKKSVQKFHPIKFQFLFEKVNFFAKPRPGDMKFADMKMNYFFLTVAYSQTKKQMPGIIPNAGINNKSQKYTESSPRTTR